MSRNRHSTRDKLRHFGEDMESPGEILHTVQENIGSVEKR